VGQGPLRIMESLAVPCHVVESTARSLGGLNRILAQAVASEARPLILAGSCNCALGVLAGLATRGIESLGIVWFDAHGDFNTPATSLSGSPDGMALAAAVGDCPELSEPCGLTKSVAQEDVVLVATRDLDPEESIRLNSSGVQSVGIGDLTAALASLATRVDAVCLHIDIDVLDPAISPGVNCTTPGGLHPGQLLAAIREVFSRVPVAAATLANYNPDRDIDNRTLKIACELAGTLKEGLL